MFGGSTTFARTSAPRRLAGRAEGHTLRKQEAFSATTFSSHRSAMGDILELFESLSNRLFYNFTLVHANHCQIEGSLMHRSTMRWCDLAARCRSRIAALVDLETSSLGGSASLAECSHPCTSKRQLRGALPREEPTQMHVDKTTWCCPPRSTDSSSMTLLGHGYLNRQKLLQSRQGA